MDKTKLATVAVVQVALEDINTHKYWHIEIKRIIKDFCVIGEKTLYQEPLTSWDPAHMEKCLLFYQRSKKWLLGLRWSTSGRECLYILHLRHNL